MISTTAVQSASAAQHWSWTGQKTLMAYESTLWLCRWIPTFRNKMTPRSSGLKWRTTWRCMSYVSSETLLYNNQVKRYHTLEHRLRVHVKVTEHHNPEYSTPVLISRSSGFKSLPENRQSEKEFIMVFLSPSRKLLGYLKMRHNRLLSHPIQFILQLTLYI